MFCPLLIAITSCSMKQAWQFWQVRLSCKVHLAELVVVAVSVAPVSQKSICWQATTLRFAAAGLAEHDVVGAVSQRFTGPEITAALAFLQQQGLVNYSGVKRPLMLSKLFSEHMEVGYTDTLTLAGVCMHNLHSYCQPTLCHVCLS